MHAARMRRWHPAALCLPLLLLLLRQNPHANGGLAAAAGDGANHTDSDGRRLQPQQRTPPRYHQHHRLPPFIHLRHPQGYLVHLPVPPPPRKTTDADDDGNDGGYFHRVHAHVPSTTPVHLALFSVVPDVENGRVVLLFEARWKEFQPFAEAYPATPPQAASANNFFSPEMSEGDVLGCGAVRTTQPHRRRQCVDMRPHFTSPWLGGLRCEFVAPDGTVLGAAGDSRPSFVEPLSVKAVRANPVFVATCAMPGLVWTSLLRGDAGSGGGGDGSAGGSGSGSGANGVDGGDAHAGSTVGATPPPFSVRVLREGDVGARPGVRAAAADGGAFETTNRQDCSGDGGFMTLFPAGDASGEACARLCIPDPPAAQVNNVAAVSSAAALADEDDVAHEADGRRRRRGDAGFCHAWQYSSARETGNCMHATSVWRGRACAANAYWAGGRRRHAAWPLVSTAAGPAQPKKLLVFGGTTPVPVDAPAMMVRIPQWIEFQLINFPDAHFFVYLHGGDGLGGADLGTGGAPGVVGGAAVLHPYIVAGVVTVVWMPTDRDNVLAPGQDGFRRRNQNDLLYRSRQLGEWVSPSVGYDQFFAPTATLDAAAMEAVVWRAGGDSTLQRVWPDRARQVDWMDDAAGDEFFPLDQHLRGVAAQVNQLVFHLWPAQPPLRDMELSLATQQVATTALPGSVHGRYLVRPLKARLLWTPAPLVPDGEGDLDGDARGRLVVGDTEINLLEFAEGSWAGTFAHVNATGNRRGYRLTQRIATAVQERLWQRYAMLS